MPRAVTVSAGSVCFQAATAPRALPMVISRCSPPPASACMDWFKFSGRGGGGGGSRGASTISMIVAFAVPPLSHIVCKPKRPPRRLNSPIRLDINMAPVAPIGWPLAIAPPFTFTLDKSPPAMAFAHANGIDEKASFTSTKSISLIFKLALARTLWVAGTGPSSISTGSIAAKPSATTRAFGFTPSFLRPRSLHISTAAAPSQICEAAAAVSVPLFSNGLSLPRDCREASFRIPSSMAWSSFGASPLDMPGRLLHGTGTTSLNRPALAAAAASWWLRNANASASSRVKPYFFATSSAPTN
mmetsp:Transcript_21302/g.38923  ORF Transcript_21302/g.38923 Transcript_21302/m.38923 type:complete len:300 (+) Transcript_21302:1538-2437(+)